MHDPGPLAGRAVLIARPVHQCQALARVIQAAGGEAIVFPTLQIVPIAPGAAARKALARLSGYDMAVFVSVNAVHTALPHVAQCGGWPAGLPAAAVGQATARALEAAGIEPRLVPPPPGDSEALLALPALRRMRGGSAVVFRGVGGREALADALRAQGVQIDYIECYQRVLPASDAAPVRSRLRQGRLHGVVAGSAEALRNLVELIGAEHRGPLVELALFVQHERVAQAARALGFVHVTVAPLEDAAMAAAIARVLGPA